MLLSSCVTVKEEFTLVSCSDNKMQGEVCEIESSYLKRGIAEVYPVFLQILGKRSLYSVASE